MTEDASFKAADRQKFKGWLQRWKQARIPLLACLFIELLSPAKVLSLAFQGEEIDTVASISHIETAKKQLQHLKRKNFEDLPTVKRFLEKVKEAEGTFSYQNITLLSFENAKGAARDAKNSLLGRIKTAMQSRLEVAENHQVLNAAIILNTEGWERSNEDGEDLTFADDSIVQLYEHFKVPLTNAGMSGSLSDLLEQWHRLLEYAKRYFDPSRTPYLRVWRKIFDSERKTEWNMVLLLVELLFAIPISNAKVERLFSLMNCVKTDSRATLSQNTLSNLVRIRMEGPKFEDYDPTPAIKLWASTVIHRPQQSKRKRYQWRTKVKKSKVMIDDDISDSAAEDSSAEEDNEENETESGVREVGLIPELEDLE